MLALGVVVAEFGAQEGHLLQLADVGLTHYILHDGCFGIDGIGVQMDYVKFGLALAFETAMGLVNVPNELQYRSMFVAPQFNFSDFFGAQSVKYSSALPNASIVPVNMTFARLQSMLKEPNAAITPVFVCLDGAIWYKPSANLPELSHRPKMDIKQFGMLNAGNRTCVQCPQMGGTANPWERLVQCVKHRAATATKPLVFVLKGCPQKVWFSPIEARTFSQLYALGIESCFVCFMQHWPNFHHIHTPHTGISSSMRSSAQELLASAWQLYLRGSLEAKSLLLCTFAGGGWRYNRR